MVLKREAEESCLVVLDAWVQHLESLASAVLVVRTRHPLREKMTLWMARMVASCCVLLPIPFAQNISMHISCNSSQRRRAPHIFNRHFNALHHACFAQNLIHIGSLIRILSQHGR